MTDYPRQDLSEAPSHAIVWPKLLPEPGPSILDEAHDAVHGARQEAYGHPLDNHTRTAAMMTAYLRGRGLLSDEAELSADDVPMLLILQKISRHTNAPKRDNLVDICGYTANLEMMEDERVRRG